AMKMFTRIFGLAIWAIAIGLTVMLVQEFTEDQDGVVTGIAYLSIAVSAIGLALSRYSWQAKAYPEMLLGFAMWIGGAGSLTFIEISYWVSSYDARFEQYHQIKTAKARLSARDDKEWKALLTGDVPATVAQIEAEIRGKRLDPAVDRSAGC